MRIFIFINLFLDCYIALYSFYFLSCIFFVMWTIFKVFIEFVTILLLFYVLVFWPQGMWDLSSPTRDRTHTPCIGRQSLNHWTTSEVPALYSLLPVSYHFHYCSFITYLLLSRTIVSVVGVLGLIFRKCKSSETQDNRYTSHKLVECVQVYPAKIEYSSYDYNMKYSL